MSSREATTGRVGPLFVARWPGTSPSVVALAGLGGGWRTWMWLAESMPTAGIVAPDLRGRGGSADLGGVPGLAGHATDVAAIAEELDLRDLVVVGHSLGAFLAPVVADRLTGRVRRVVLLDGGLPPKLPAFLRRRALVRWKFRSEARRNRGPWTDVDSFVAATLAPSVAGRPDLLPAVTRWVADDLIGPPGRLTPRGNVDLVVEDAVDTFFGTDTADALARLDVPVHLLAATAGATDRDPPFLADSVLDEARGRLPGLTARRVAANHTTLMFAPETAAAVAAVDS